MHSKQQAKIRRRISVAVYHETSSDEVKHSLSTKSSTLSRHVDSRILEPSKCFKTREYLLLFVEMALSQTHYVLQERNFTLDELLRANRTEQQAGIYMLSLNGHSAWLSLILGCLADSYITHYTLAFISVVIHFAAVSVVFIEEVAKSREQRNTGADAVHSICIVAIALIRSTDFSRLIYALEGMTDRRMSTICVFMVFQFWASKYALYGGPIVNVYLLFTGKNPLIRAIGSFAGSGLSLFIFSYFLDPEQHLRQKGLGCRIVGCLLLATFYKVFRIKKRPEAGFLNQTEGTFTKRTISLTKSILILYTLLTPTFANALSVVLNEDIFFRPMIRAVKGDKGLAAFFGPYQVLLRFCEGIAILLSYFVLWPLLTLVGFKNNNRTKFLVGHSLFAAALFYGALLLKLVGKVQLPQGSGFVRVFNTRDDPVYFSPREGALHSFEVQPKTAVMGAHYSSRGALMFAMNVNFTTEGINYTMFMQVNPGETTGYVVLDPPEVVRIRGPFLPLQEGPPGTNLPGQGRLYVYNTAQSLDGAMIKIKHAHSRRTLRQVTILPGALTTIALTPATYNFSIYQAEISQTLSVKEGAVYGIMIYATPTSREMTIDCVLSPDSEPIGPALVYFLLIGLSTGLSYPALRALLFSIAPPELLAMSFAYTAVLEGLASYFMYIGFKTWHYHVTSNVAFSYAAGVAVFSCVCMFVMLKYKRFNV